MGQGREGSSHSWLHWANGGWWGEAVEAATVVGPSPAGISAALGSQAGPVQGPVGLTPLSFLSHPMGGEMCGGSGAGILGKPLHQCYLQGSCFLCGTVPQLVPALAVSVS